MTGAPLETVSPSWLSDGLIQIMWNVIGGAVTVGLFELYRRLRRFVIGKHYRAVFGDDVSLARRLRRPGIGWP